MRIKVSLILFIIFSLVNVYSNEEVINDYEKPLYERISLIKDYRINQPIKYAIRWGSIGLFVGLRAGYNYELEKDYHGQTDFSSYFPYAWEVSKISMLCGGFLGLYKGFKAQNIKKNDSDYTLPKDNFGYEVSLMIDPLKADDQVTDRIINGIYLTYSRKFKFINEFQIGLTWIRWPELQESIRIHKELKYDFKVIHYGYCMSIFSPYYGFGGGLSYGKSIHDDWYYDDSKIISKGVYPFVHSIAGIRVSFFDFFYFKIETDFELSTFYFKASSYEHYSFLTNFSMGLVLGAKIF